MIYAPLKPLPKNAIDTRPPPPYLTCVVLKTDEGFTLRTTFTGHNCPALKAVDEHVATRKEIRKLVPKGMTWTPREAGDADNVIGTWQ